jgi:tricorn protease
MSFLRTTVGGLVPLLLFVSGAVATPAGGNTSAQPAALPGEALWLRQPALSPDGSRIAFSYLGEVCVVSAEGGVARVLTRDPGTDGQPVWSPDGRSLVLSTTRHGNADLYRLDLDSGAEQRLTWHSARDTPWFVDGQDRVWFSSSRGEGAACAIFPNGRFDELYSIGLDGKGLRRELETPAHFPDRRPDGALIYQDVRGVEDDFRKHHTSSAARDLWLAPADGSEHRRITSFAGEDLEPAWLPDGTSYAWLSERGGTLNIWQTRLEGGTPVQLTHHAGHPVRSLTVAATGRMCYTQDGALWTLDPGDEPRRLAVQVPLAPRSGDAITELHGEGALGAVLSPDGAWIAFTVRGDLFVTSTAHGTTRRLTETAWQERDPCFTPTGDSIVFVSRKPGDWRLGLARTEGDRAGGWLEQPRLAVEPLGPAGQQPLAPQVSPDGKQVVFMAERCAVRLLTLADGKVKELLPLERHYTYTDDGNRLRWSPDGKHVALAALDSARWSDELWLLPVDGSPRFNISDSGYEDFHPVWSADGQSLYCLTDRSGMKVHGSWGFSSDIWMHALSDSSWWRHKLSEERFEFLVKADEDSAGEEESEELAKPARGSKPARARKRDKDVDKAPDAPVLDLAAARWRRDRITLASAEVADFVVLEDGERILSLARFEDRYELWETLPRKGEMSRFADLGLEDGASLAVDADQAFVYVLGGDEGFLKVDLESAEVEPVGWNAEIRLDPAAERRALLEHVRIQVRDRFYDPKLHGVDWDGLCDHYASFLPHIDTMDDFAELLSELLGELNASHTGAFSWSGSPVDDSSAELGLLLESDGTGGLAIGEVLRDGPFDQPGITVVPGERITAVNGHSLADAEDLARELNRRAGQPLAVTLAGSKGSRDLTVRPWGRGEQREALYRRWVRRNEARVDSLSGGRLGYVHIRDMDDPSFRRLVDRALGPYSDREALVVDTRSNGGGNLANDLVQFFSGKRLFLSTVPPDNRVLGEEPWSRWNRPVIVVMDESNYSDSHIFPASMRAMGLAELVGMPVAGTGTAVWWEELVCGNMVFGIPQVGFLDNTGRYLENQQLEPDLKVENPPRALAAGRDLQLEAAVTRLLGKLE